MLPYLDIDSEFPPVENSLSEPNGLLAAGADLSCKRLISAYSKGIFPWYSDDEPILWWSPNPRTVFLVDHYTPSKSLVKFAKKMTYTVTINAAFKDVVIECAAPRKNQDGTWITQDIIAAYSELHQKKVAHSVEVWDHELLVGGIYGVSIGKLFCGESMFSRVPNGSKIALSCLIGYLKNFQFPVIDCQVENAHLLNLGAVNIERKEYIDIVNNNICKTVPASIWQQRLLNHVELISRSSMNTNLVD